MNRKRQPLFRGKELRVDAHPIAAWISTVPADAWKEDRVKRVQTEAPPFVVQAESLVAQPGSESVGAEQRRQKMTLRVAIAAAFKQYL